MTPPRSHLPVLAHYRNAGLGILRVVDLLTMVPAAAELSVVMALHLVLPQAPNYRQYMAGWIVIDFVVVATALRSPLSVVK